MAEPSMLSRLSESSRGALDLAQGYAEARGSRQIEPPDLWAGVLRTHGNDSPPRVLLSHFRIPLENFTSLLSPDPLSMLPLPSGRPAAMETLAPETMKVLDLAISLGEQYNREEGGMVRLRDLFGALLLAPSRPLSSYRRILEGASISSEEVIQAYQEYLSRPRASLKRFLDERFPRRAGQTPPPDPSQAPAQASDAFDPSQQAIPTQEAPTDQEVAAEPAAQQQVVPPEPALQETPEEPGVQQQVPPVDPTLQELVGEQVLEPSSPGNGHPPGGTAGLSMQMAVSGFSSDTRAQKDLVGIGAEVDAFAYLISARALKPPLAIGLFGDWGSGKTYFMQSLKERIFKITDDARKSGSPQKELAVHKYIVQIEFNAWHYVEGELWASLVENILHNLQTRNGESPSLLQKRQQKLIDEMNRKRRDQSLASEQKSTLETELAVKQDEIKTLKVEQEEVLRKLDELKTQDVLDAVELNPQERQDLKRVLDDMGVSGSFQSALDFMEAFEQLKGELEQSSALAVVLRRRGWSWTLGIAGVILAGPLASLAISMLVGEGVPAVTNAVLSFSATLSGLTLLLRAGTKEVASLRERVEAAQARLESRRKAEEQRFAEQIMTLEKELQDKRKEYQSAVAVEQELAGQIEALEAELGQITPRRVLLDFISERVESQDYRKWLGVPALIRRDFNQLSELVQEQNDAFLENDDGQERNPDQINRIVLYIDDLDRCPPRRVAEVLQAVHLLLAFPLFVVVVAVDSRWLSQSLQTHYGSLLSPENAPVQNGGVRATPQDYLEKIFQIPFWVSPLGDQARMRIIHGLVAGSLVSGDSSQGSETPKGGEVLLDRTPTSGPDGEPGVHEQPEDQEQQPGTEGPAGTTIEWTEEETAREYDPQAETNPNPPGLDILDLELAFMQDLRTLLGETPRSVKRFVNVYWLMKSIALSQSEEFIASEPFAGFKRVQFLLATLTGLPALAHELFALLLSEQSPEKSGGKVGIQRAEMALSPEDDLQTCLEVLRNRLTRRRSRGENVESALSEMERLKNWLESYDEGRWLSLATGELKEWAPMAARFSYRMEE